MAGCAGPGALGRLEPGKIAARTGGPAGPKPRELPRVGLVLGSPPCGFGARLGAAGFVAAARCVTLPARRRPGASASHTPRPSRPVIEVQDLTRRFGQHLAVDGISFRLEAGEVVGFLGPNGAGKTTTMRMLTGYLPATRGSIRVGGFDVLRDSLEVRRRIGYLPENVPLFRELRVIEMLELQARLHQIPVKERAGRIARVLERVGLTERRRSPIGSLSRGLRQRAGLAVALLPAPAVLILDEPTSGLDPLQRREVRALVRELASEHTVLLSSHILAEVEAVCPRVIILNRGRIVADGRRESLVESLGGSHVVFEAVVGNPAEAQRLLSALPGVEGVEDRGRSGIHHGFFIRGASDLREDVGALAAQRRWAVRELSWHVPSLEKLFVRLSLGLDEPSEGAPASPLAEPLDGRAEWVERGGPAAAAGAPASAGKAVYNLNPFAAGGQRDLSAPLALPPQPTAARSATAGGPAAGAAAPAPERPTYANLNPFENFGQPKAARAAAPPSPGAGGEAAAPGFVSLNPFDRFGQGRERVHGPGHGAQAPAEAQAEARGPGDKPGEGPAPGAEADRSDPPPAPEPPRYANLNPFENFGRPRGPEPRP